MSDRSSLLKDLDYAARIAREGANTPLLGGVYFLIWSGLLVPTLVAHGCVLLGYLPLERSQLGLLWMGYGITGIVASAIYGFRNFHKPGNNSFLNRLSRAAGIVLSLLLISFVVTTGWAVSAGRLSIAAFNFILPFAFGLNAFHLGVLGWLSGKPYLKVSAGFAGATMVVTLYFSQSPEIYFFAAGSVLFCLALPGSLELRDEKLHGPE